jgi:predicted O-linked N-acetylglucosamine transferase (SPINDLY family)
LARGAARRALGCFNSFSKVSSNVLTTWCELLKFIPESTLALTCPDGSSRRIVLERMNHAGIDAGRITFVRNAPMATYFSMYHHIDIALNPFPYPGGTTTCDALWMGVPVVSMSGKTAASRGPLSILSNVGLGDLVARSPQQYIGIASTLASDVPRLSELRTALRQRMQSSPLMNARQFTKDVEAAFRVMWRRWCATK